MKKVCHPHYCPSCTVRPLFSDSLIHRLRVIPAHCIMNCWRSRTATVILLHMVIMMGAQGQSLGDTVWFSDDSQDYRDYDYQSSIRDIKMVPLFSGDLSPTGQADRNPTTRQDPRSSAKIMSSMALIMKLANYNWMERKKEMVSRTVWFTEETSTEPVKPIAIPVPTKVTTTTSRTRARRPKVDRFRFRAILREYENTAKVDN